MTSKRLYQLLLLSILGLLVGSGALSIVFFNLVAHDKAAPAGQGTESGGAAPRPAALTHDVTPAVGHVVPALEDLHLIGPSGVERKFAVRRPGAPTVAGTVSRFASGGTNRAAGAAADLSVLPSAFRVDCSDYGGEMNLAASGASLNIFAGDGEVCMELYRHEIRLDQGETRIYSTHGGEINACDLDEQLMVCMKLHGVNADAHVETGSWAAGEPTANTNAITAADRFWKWHLEAVKAAGAAHGRAGQPPAAVRSPSGLTQEALPLHNNSFVGNDPRQWFTDLPEHTRVEYKDVYPGIDMSCYAEQGRFEYVFVVWPGADPSQIRFGIDGAEDLVTDPLGNLNVYFRCGKMTEGAPVLYQIVNGQARLLRGSYTIRDREVRFDVAPYDRTRELYVSPRLDFLSYLGGRAADTCYAVAVDDAGCAYAAGETFSGAFSTRPAKPGEEARKSCDIFVTKYRVADGRVLYTTILGGGGEDRPFGIVADRDGNAYVCGETLSDDFPSTNTIAGWHGGQAWDAFLTKLDPAGRIVGFSGRFGGSGDDRAFGLALAADGSLYVAGETTSADLPVTGALQKERAGEGLDGFVVKIDPQSMRVAYCTYLGGRGPDSIFDVAADPMGAAYVTGETASEDFPVTAGGLQRAFQGGRLDGFVAKLTPAGDRLLYATYLGGINDDRGLGIRADAAGNAYVVGETASENFPTTNAVQPRYAGGAWDAFAVKLTPDGAPPVYATYLGGSGTDRAFGVAPDAMGRVYLAGMTDSTNFPTLKPFQASYAGGAWDGFAAKLDAAGVPMLATYLGGSSNDALFAAAVDPVGGGVLGGSTASTNLPVVNALQGRLAGGDGDALLARIAPEPQFGPELRRVPGRDDGLPEYDYFVSKYELTNEEFVRFLNNAQANTNNARGAHMYFDEQGNVWFNAAKVRERDEMFNADASRIRYHATYPLGARYSVTPKIPPQGGSYTNHPITGVSWYGAVKYCNWLTISTGRGEAEQCYREGTNTWDWAPVTCSTTNWARGDFTAEERLQWLAYKGFRLPMDNCATPMCELTPYLRVSVADFVRFLNDADKWRRDPRGKHMVYDIHGNVWFNPSLREQSGELYRIDPAQVWYDPARAPGDRYAAATTTSAGGNAIAAQTVTGVTWPGAMKYCNWMTLARGYEVRDCTYREGTNAIDWAPVTCSVSNWISARFDAGEERAWLSMRGTRLPLDTQRSVPPRDLQVDLYPATNSWPNAFNEFLKAGSGGNGSNVVYGFGRSKADARDANYLNSGAFVHHDTTPVGFYDGTTHGGSIQTSTNDNRYGIYDLSGNVDEWLTDPGKIGSIQDRACYGGSWMFVLPPLTQRAYVNPYFTDRFRGFRVVTTAGEQSMYVVRVPYRLCLCGRGTGPGCGEGVEKKEVKKEEKEVAEGEAAAEEAYRTLTVEPPPGPWNEGFGPKRPVTTTTTTTTSTALTTTTTAGSSTTTTVSHPVRSPSGL